MFDIDERVANKLTDKLGTVIMANPKYAGTLFKVAMMSKLNKDKLVLLTTKVLDDDMVNEALNTLLEKVMSSIEKELK